MHNRSNFTSEAVSKYKTAIALHNAGRLPEALKLYQDIVVSLKKDADIFFRIANIQKQLKNYKDAMSNINKAIKIDDKIKKYYYERASIRTELKQFENALDDLKYLLKNDPNDNYVLAAISSIHFRKNDFERALHFIDAALQMDAQNINALFNKAKILETMGKFGDALKSYLKCLESDPKNIECLNNIGYLYTQMNNFEFALEYLNRATSVEPKYLLALYNKANVYLKSGRYEAAVLAFDEILVIDQTFLPAYNNRGISLLMQNRYRDAIASFEAALELDSDNNEALVNLGKCLKETHDYSKSRECYNRAIEINSNEIEAYKSRGILNNFLNNNNEAISDFKCALQIDPNDAEAHCGLADALLSLNAIDLAFEEYTKAIEIEQEYPEAYWNRSGIYLLKGDYKNGLKDNEWRKKTSEFRSPNLNPSLELKPGLDLNSKHVFIYPELYLGDLIQFSRFALLANSRGAIVTMAAPEKMHKLLKTISKEINFISKDEIPKHYDYHCALMSLPYAFNISAETIPFGSQYMTADPMLINKWREKIGRHGFKVGICWQGSTLPYSIPLRRSVHLSNFYNISKMKDVRLISLQKHDGIEQFSEIPQDMRIEVIDEEIDQGPNAFVDTAAILSNLDLVITVDTAVAHLAGALGRPTWLILKDVPDWRWLLDRKDTPWYDSIKLFRNMSRDNWNNLFLDLEKELQNYVAELK